MAWSLPAWVSACAAGGLAVRPGRLATAELPGPAWLAGPAVHPAASPAVMTAARTAAGHPPPRRLGGGCC
jgi:hypothetical protein